jgi:hypothetical protein
MTLPIGNVPQIPFQLASGGLRTELGTFTPPGGRVVAYVHHEGAPRLADITAATTVPNVCKTLNEALRQCKSGWGDTVLVLPGHAENISAADQMSYLVAGTRIIGLGNGNNRPTFTWTIATSTFLLDVANVRIENCILNMDPGAGTVSVAAPITVSAAGCQIVNCKMRVSTDANSKATIPITTTAAGDDLEIDCCEILGATAGEVTTVIRAVGADQLKITNTRIVAATSAVAIGVLQFLTTASLNVFIHNCFFRNNKAASTAAVTGLTGTTGFADRLFMGTLANGAAQLVLADANGAWAANADGMMFGVDVVVVNLAGESAARATPLSA